MHFDCVRNFFQLVRLLGFLGVPGLPSLVAAIDISDRPNIVLIYTDDIGYGDVGCYGATKVRTPHIDRLAREGRRFTDAHSASAVCTPSRYALLTGEYPLRSDSWGPVFSRTGLIIDPEKTTLASLLKRRDYATACIGKWHLGLGEKGKAPDWNGELKPGPRELGFDYYFGLPTVSSHSPFVLVENSRVLGLDPADPLVFGGTPPTQRFPEKNLVGNPMSGGRAAHALYRDEELGTLFTQKAVAWLREKRGAPFFLYFATPHIHHPFTPHPRFRGTSECGRYGDFIHELDWMVGELLATLDELKLTENTLVIFTSDNGPWLGYGIDGGSAGPLREGKGTTWEGGVRVPAIFRWPGKIPAARRTDAVAANFDLLPTFARLAGARPPQDRVLDGRDLWPVLSGESTRSPHRHFHYLGGNAAGTINYRGVRDERWKLLVSVDPAGQIAGRELYDLGTDLGEKFDRFKQHPEIAQRLTVTAQQFYDELRANSRPAGRAVTAWRAAMVMRTASASL